jgi:ABC-type nitrate/sulfonate/bicarbonate transport system substrate-binding protein
MTEMSTISEIWYTRCPLPSASGIAQRRRWLHDCFTAAGVTPRTVRTSPDCRLHDADFTHLQPALFREGDPVPALWTRSLGRDTALIGVTRIIEAQAVLVRADSGAKTTADLKGLRLGVPRRPTCPVDPARAHALFGFSAVLGQSGLTLGDTRLTDVDWTKARQRECRSVDALLRSDVDAIYVTGPRIGQFIEKHRLVPLPLGSGPAVAWRPGAPRPVTVNRVLAQEHPEIVARYLAVMLQAARWAEANPSGAAEVLGWELGLKSEELLSGFGPDLHRQLHVSLKPGPLAALAEQKRFLLAHGFLPRDFDFQSWIVAEPLVMAEGLIRLGWPWRRG